jgi:hypothetical protein
MTFDFKRIRNITVKQLLYYPLMVFCCLEIAFRILGYEHFKNNDYSVVAHPENAFVGDAELGIQHQPGNFQITINHGLTFQAHHLDSHARYVSGCPHPERTDILLLGCSFTYGFGVNDEQHFTSLLQQKHPDLSFRNAGVIGSGSVQSLLQLKKLVKTQPLQAVILNFSSFHFMRNTLSRQYRSNLKIGYGRSSHHVDNQMKQSRFPYLATCEESIQYAPWEEIYENWTGREWLASINWMQTVYDYTQEDLPAQMEATVCLIREMAAICKANHIAFGIACLDSTPETDLLKTKVEPLAWVDIGFDFSNQSRINYPYDSHPNPAGHQQIADKMDPFLSKLLHER